jgi:hypothetical protein
MRLVLCNVLYCPTRLAHRFLAASLTCKFISVTRVIWSSVFFFLGWNFALLCFSKRYYFLFLEKICALSPLLAAECEIFCLPFTLGSVLFIGLLCLHSFISLLKILTACLWQPPVCVDSYQNEQFHSTVHVYTFPKQMTLATQ